MLQEKSSSGYRAYVMFILVVVYTFNFIDRQIIGILAVPIKADLALTDTQLGLMGDLAFALFYTALGIPIAMLADRGNRTWIMTIALALWSAMTAVCGTVQNFWQLFVARLGVGEAGGVAPAYSLISDYYPPQRRARALSIYSFGIPIGSALGIVFGGVIASKIASGEVRYAPANMLAPEEIRTMIDDANDQFSGIDILINNAGIQFVSPIQEFPIDQWNDIIAINLSSSFHTIRAAIPRMIDNGWGRIVNVASIHALVASPFKAAYVAAKHGIAGLTKTVALELAAKNITVNAVAPGYVKTPLVTGQIADTAKVRGLSEKEVVKEVMLAAQPTRHFVTIKQVADLVLYLCGEQASAITGTILPIDGGWSAQ